MLHKWTIKLKYKIRKSLKKLTISLLKQKREKVISQKKKMLISVST